MTVGIVLLLMLVAIFAMAGIHHLLVWMRSKLAREHLWFGLASFAAAGAVAAYCAVYRGATAADILTAQYVSASFSIVWLAATTWFTVEYAGGNSVRRWIAGCTTAIFAALLLRNLFVYTTEEAVLLLDSGSSRVLGGVALAALSGLVIDGSIGLWRSARRFRAVTLSAGIGIALVGLVLHGTLLDRGLAQFPSPTPYTFLIVVIMMNYELAASMAEMLVLSQRQRQELAHASRLSIVGELTASIAHEINQPLGAILSNADAGEILLEGPDPPLEEIRQILADIRRDGLRASGVIRHVRALVRKRELELEKLDANDLAAGVIALLEPETRRRRLSIGAALAPRPVWLRGDRVLIEQVLINLVMNALDAVEAACAAGNPPAVHPPIRLGVSTTSHGEVEFQVVDTGQGIPGEHLEHLFDSFHTSKAHGMGLGLSIARSIAEAHGGRIKVENNRGAGATLRVTLAPYDGPEG